MSLPAHLTYKHAARAVHNYLTKLLAHAGVEYECKLNQMLTDADIAFWTEEDLREKGFYKTPDAKLQVHSHVETWHAFHNH